MTLRMADSVTVANLPLKGYDAYAGYTSGLFTTFPALQELLAELGVHLLSIAIDAAHDADCLDIEARDATNAQAPGWVMRQQKRGEPQPVVYTSASNAAALIATLREHGIARSQYRLWSAHYGHGKHICGPGQCQYPQADGTQWTDSAPGNGGSKIDESLLAAGFFGATPTRKHREDPMLLDPGGTTPVAFPDGAKGLRFASNLNAELRVDFYGHAPTTDFTVNYGSAHQVPIPDGCHAAIVHRDDTGSQPVSVVVS
jgi:hypothetical protein